MEIRTGPKEEGEMRFDPRRGEIVDSLGEDWVMISGEALRRIYANDVTMLGTGANVIWYNSGRAVGKKDGEKYASSLERMGLDELAAKISSSYASLGWGKIEIGKVDLENSEIVFTMKNSPMVRGITDKNPRCWYVRGFVEGLASTILGMEAVASESRCEAVNGGYCEFKVSWKTFSNK